MTAGGLYVESSSRVGAPDTKSEPAKKMITGNKMGYLLLCTLKHCQANSTYSNLIQVQKKAGIMDNLMKYKVG
jgi:hypothetical protein